MIQTFQAGSECYCIEIHEQSRRISGEFQVGNHLRLMDRVQTLDGLQFQDDAVVDKQIQPEPAADGMPFLLEGNRPLPVEPKMFPRHLDHQAFPVDVLQ